MRRALLAFLLIGAVLAGCAKAPPVPAPPDSSAPAPAPAPSAPAAPLPAGPCVPGASAVTLPSRPYGTGVDLQPPPPGKSSEHPWFGYLSASQMDEPTAYSSGGIIGTIVMRKGGTATVDAAEFMLSGFLMPAPTTAWFQTHLTIEGVHPIDQQFNAIGDYGNFDLRIPAGKPGDPFRLTLKGVLLDDGTTGDLVVDFCRQTPPKATLTYQGRPVSADATANAPIPADAPLTVRLSFTQAMLRDSVERSLKGPHDKTGQSQGDWITSLKWLDARTVDLTADRPEPTMRLNLASAQDQFGLFVTGGVPNLYSGEPPQILAVEPASGRRTRLAVIPPEPNGATLSPNGQLLRLVTWQMRGGRDVPDARTLLVDLATGASKPLQPDDPGWAPPDGIASLRFEGLDSLLLIRQGAAGREEVLIPGLPALDSYYASPDGKWIAALTRTGAPSPEPYVTVQFQIIATHDVTQRKTLTGETTMFRPGKDGIVLYGPVWSPDSTRIALTQSTPDGAALLLADPAEGALRTLAANLPGVRASWDPVTWSPDGSKVLVGPLLVDAATGQVLQRIDGLQGKPFWSSDGQWLLSQPDHWTEINAYDLRTGKRMSLGEGLALGWSPNGEALLIRWPNAKYRVIWGL